MLLSTLPAYTVEVGDTTGPKIVSAVFIVLALVFMAGIAYFFIRVLPRWGRRGTHYAKTAKARVSQARGAEVVGGGIATSYGQPNSPSWVPQHPLGQCPPLAPRHGSDGLCQFCSWAHVAGLDGPWGSGRATLPISGWLTYIDRVLDATGTPWFYGMRDAWGVPRVIPGEPGWEAEEAWLRTVAANGGVVYWPATDVWGRPLAGGAQ